MKVKISTSCSSTEKIKELLETLEAFETKEIRIDVDINYFPESSFKADTLHSDSSFMNARKIVDALDELRE